MEPRLRDVIAALEKRGRCEDEEYAFCSFFIPFKLMLFHGLSEEQVLNMTIDEIKTWWDAPIKPLKYEGWNFYWGEAAFADSRKRDA